MRLGYTLRRVARFIAILHYIVTIGFSLLDLGLYATTLYVRRALYPAVFRFHLVARGVPRDLRKSLALRYREYLGSNLSLTRVLRYLSRTSRM